MKYKWLCVPQGSGWGTGFVAWQVPKAQASCMGTYSSLAALLLIQPSANDVWKAKQDSSNAGDPVSHMEDLEEASWFLSSGFSLT